MVYFPEEASVKRVKQGSSRIVILEWKTGRKLFFWMQETAEDKDDEVVNQMNHYINNPPLLEPESPGQGFQLSS